MTNADFLTVISKSFAAFIQSGTSRSTDKLKPLHGAIAKDIAERLGAGFEVVSFGHGKGKEMKMRGRYLEKTVDISVCSNNEPLAGVAVKFIVQSYSQNSNNYFENMLGETANIRCGGYPYFQIFIILDRLPHYNNNYEITKWETFTGHNVDKYVTMSKDDIGQYRHTPNKTLIYVIHVPDEGRDFTTKKEYDDFYRDREVEVVPSEMEYGPFGKAVILNDYETFMNKVYHTIMSL